MKSLLERLKEVYRYDPETGEFFWRYRHNQRKTGYVGKRGCVELQQFGRKFKAHIVAWAFYYGEWPTSIIDHKDNDPTNNRIENLRLATQQQNCMNRRKQDNYTASIYKGVIRSSSSKNPWRARININGKGKSLGMFKTEAEAHLAYCKAAGELFKEFARFE